MSHPASTEWHTKDFLSRSSGKTMVLAPFKSCPPRRTTCVTRERRRSGFVSLPALPIEGCVDGGLLHQRRIRLLQLNAFDRGIAHQQQHVLPQRRGARLQLELRRNLFAYFGKTR